MKYFTFQCIAFHFDIIVLENGAFQRAKVLVILKKRILIFLPPYSPKLYPAEKKWQTIIRNFTNKFHPLMNFFYC